MPDIATRIDRLHELSSLLLQMTQSHIHNNNDTFWKLNQEFKDLTTIYQLEDEIQEG